MTIVKVKCVEELGVEADGNFSKLAVIEITNDIDWVIINNGGMEHIAEKHKTWG